jgi:hypothetical protein
MKKLTTLSILALMLCAAPLFGASSRANPMDTSPPTTVANELFYYSAPDGGGNAYGTALVLKNTTAAEIAVPDVITTADGSAFLNKNFSVPAYQTVRVKGWPRTGGGTQILKTPTGITASTDMTDLHGSTITIPTLKRYSFETVVQIQGFRTSGTDHALVFASAGTTIDFYDGAKQIGETVQVPITSFPIVPSGANRAVIKSIIKEPNLGIDGSYVCYGIQLDGYGAQLGIEPTTLAAATGP